MNRIHLILCFLIFKYKKRQLVLGGTWVVPLEVDKKKQKKKTEEKNSSAVWAGQPLAGSGHVILGLSAIRKRPITGSSGYSGPLLKNSRSGSLCTPNFFFKVGFGLINLSATTYYFWQQGMGGEPISGGRGGYFWFLADMGGKGHLDLFVFGWHHIYVNRPLL